MDGRPPAEDARQQDDRRRGSDTAGSAEVRPAFDDELGGRAADQDCEQQALLLLCVPILLYLISHLAVPELDDGRTHDMREYYYRHGRWMQGLLLAVLVSGAAAQLVIEGRPDFSGAGSVRAAAAIILVPGIVSGRPVIHATQAVLLVLVMLYAISYVARPIG